MFTKLLMEYGDDACLENVHPEVECVVDGQVFNVHRDLLISFSPYLKNKLVIPDGKRSKSKINIPHIGSQEFEVLLRYMYTGDLKLECGNFLDVYKASSMLEMEDVRQRCLQLIDGKEEIRTYFYSYVISKQTGVYKSWQRALKLIAHRFEEAVFTQEFLQLSSKYAVEILSSQRIGARSEVIVFLAALHWLNYDYEHRRDDCCKIMDCVRFSCMTAEEIIACYHPPFLREVVVAPEVRNMLLKATCFITAKNQGQETWFREYANKKRTLTMQSLPMVLWHDRRRHTLHRGLLSFSMESETKSKTSAGKTESSSSDPVAIIATKTGQENKYFELLDEHLEKEAVSTESKEENELLNLYKNSDESTGFGKNRNLIQPRECSVLRIPGEASSSSCLNTDLHKRKVSKPEIISLRRNSAPKFLEENIRKLEQYDKALFATPKPTKIVSVEEISDTNKRQSGSHAKDKNDSRVPLKKQKEQEVMQKEGTIRKYSLFVIGGLDPKKIEPETSSVILYFQEDHKEWIQFTNLPEPRHNHGSVIIDDNMYIIGGCNTRDTRLKSRNTAVRLCFQLNLKTKKWVPMPKMKQARYDHGVIAYQGKIFVIGGQGENERLLKSSEVFDPKSGKWKTLPDNLSYARKAMGVSVYDNQIWIVGGLIQFSKAFSTQPVSFVDCYDPARKKWSFNVYVLPSPRCFCSLVVWNDFLYCIGGSVYEVEAVARPTDEVLCFDRDGDKVWTSEPALPEPRTGGAALNCGQRLLFVGGCSLDSESSVSDVYCLNEESSCWETVSTLPSQLLGISAVCIAE